MACNALDWSEISPAIFGSMFQSVLDVNETDADTRREFGAHYTSEKNILTSAVNNGEKYLVDYVRQPDGKSLGTLEQVI